MKNGLNSGNDCWFKNLQIIRHTELLYLLLGTDVQFGLSHGGNGRVRALRNTVMISVRTCEGRSKWRLEKIAHGGLCDLYSAKYY